MRGILNYYNNFFSSILPSYAHLLRISVNDDTVSLSRIFITYILFKQRILHGHLNYLTRIRCTRHCIYINFLLFQHFLSNYFCFLSALVVMLQYAQFRNFSICNSNFYLCINISGIPWTVACQAPLSMGFSRQEYCSGLPCPPPGDLPNPGI